MYCHLLLLFLSSYVVAVVPPIFDQLSQTPFSVNQDPTACPVGKQWFVCKNNNFKGCCSVDPCNMSNCPDSTLPPAPPCPGKTKRQFQPQMFTLWPTNGSRLATTGSNINLDPFSAQLIIFPPLGPTAVNCQLRWFVPKDRVFEVNQSGLTDVSPITTPLLQPAKLSWNSIKGAVGKVQGAADFTNWPQVDGAHDHSVTPVSCRGPGPLGRVALLTQLRKTAEPPLAGTVKLSQGAMTGWYMQYDC